LNGVDEPLSIRIIRTAVDRGINFMDNCWDYNEGAREIRMGKRRDVFLTLRHGRLVQSARAREGIW
jgi:predicted aldo/keto reductase-like oxidoreductase